MNIKQMIAKGLLISLMAGAVTGWSAFREKNIVFNSAQEEPPIMAVGRGMKNRIFFELILTVICLTSIYQQRPLRLNRLRPPH